MAENQLSFKVDDGEIVIDRSKFLHGDTKRVTVLQMRLKKAERDLDPDTYEQSWNEIETLFARMITSVPESWTARGIDLMTPGWMDTLPAPIFDDMILAINPPTPGEKRA